MEFTLAVCVMNKQLSKIYAEFVDCIKDIVSMRFFV